MLRELFEKIGILKPLTADEIEARELANESQEWLESEENRCKFMQLQKQKNRLGLNPAFPSEYIDIEKLRLFLPTAPHFAGISEWMIRCPTRTGTLFCAAVYHCGAVRIPLRFRVYFPDDGGGQQILYKDKHPCMKPELKPLYDKLYEIIDDCLKDVSYEMIERPVPEED
jgi:hypothetical protein